MKTLLHIGLFPLAVLACVLFMIGTLADALSWLLDQLADRCMRSAQWLMEDGK